MSWIQHMEKKCASLSSSLFFLLIWDGHQRKISSPALENWSDLLRAVSAISGMVTLFLLFIHLFIFGLVWLNDRPVSRLTAGGLDDLLCVCPGEGPGSGELLDLLLLQMTLARDTERWAGEQKKSQWSFEPPVPGRFQNLLHTGCPESACCLLKATIFLTCLYPLATHVCLLFKADHSLRSLLKLSSWSMAQTRISAHPIIWWAAGFTEIFMVPRGWNPSTFPVACR